jgi:hypothetical protein
LDATNGCDELGIVDCNKIGSSHGSSELGDELGWEPFHRSYKVGSEAAGDCDKPGFDNLGFATVKGSQRGKALVDEGDPLCATA